MENISLDDFKKLEIRIGTILTAEKIEGSDKLLKLDVVFGMNEAGEPIKRQIVSGIAQFYTPESLIGKQCPFAFNLEPKMLKGVESQGMILAAGAEGPVLLNPDKEVPSGSLIK
jgi:methionine--tRNA ligase beta chain